MKRIFQITQVLLLSISAHGQERIIGDDTYVLIKEHWYLLKNNITTPIVPNRIFVRHRTGLRMSDRELASYGLLSGKDIELNYTVSETNPGADSFAIVERLLDDGHYASFDIILELASITPNDFYFSPDGPFWGQWNLFKIGMPSAWNYVLADPEIVVAIVDTGVEYTHEDLSGNLWTNPLEVPGNNIDDDHNGKKDDTHGWDFTDDDNDPTPGFFNQHGMINQDTHGTSVCGIIAAEGNNQIGMAGIAGGLGMPGVSYLPIRTDLMLSHALGSVKYAVETGAHVVNLSWGTAYNYSMMEEIFSHLASNFQSILVCAVGNRETDPVFYPAAYPFTIAVGSTNEHDFHEGSNIGPQVDIAAPTGVITTDIMGELGSTTLEGDWAWRNGVFSYNYNPVFQGSSGAAPHVSGIIALMRSGKRGLTLPQIRSALHNSAEKVGVYNYYWNPDLPGQSRELGYGRLRANLAISLTQNLPTLQMMTPQPATFFDEQSPVSITWNRSGYNGPVRIELYNNNGYVQTLATGLAGSAYVWVNPGNLVFGHDYRIKVVAQNDPEIYNFNARPFSLSGVGLIDIPDPNLQAALIELGYDTNQDQSIDQQEALAVTNLDISGREISDLTGIEGFTNLVYLNCSHNQIRDMGPVARNEDFMSSCQKSIDFSYNLLDEHSPVGTCDIACSPWSLIIAAPQAQTINCLCWDPDCTPTE